MKLELLTRDDITYDYSGKRGKKNKAIDEFGTYAYPSDLSFSNGIRVENLCSPYWIDSEITGNYVKAVNSGNGYRSFHRTDTSVGIRPKVRYSDISELIPSDYLGRDVYQTEAFEYIGCAVDFDLGTELDQLSVSGELMKTGKTYTVGATYNEESDGVEYENTDEYYYNGNKYVLVETKDLCFLSNGVAYKPGECHWHKVEPVKLIVSLADDTVVFKKILISGIPFSFKKCSSASESFVQKFMDERLSNELIPSNVLEINFESDHSEPSKKM